MTATMIASAVIVALVVALIFQQIAITRANEAVTTCRETIKSMQEMQESLRLPHVTVEYDHVAGTAEINVGDHLAAATVVMHMDEDSGGGRSDHGAAIVKLLQVMSHSAPPLKSRR